MLYELQTPLMGREIVSKLSAMIEPITDLNTLPGEVFHRNVTNASAVTLLPDRSTIQDSRNPVGIEITTEKEVQRSGWLNRVRDSEWQFVIDPEVYKFELRLPPLSREAVRYTSNWSQDMDIDAIIDKTGKLTSTLDELSKFIILRAQIASGKSASFVRDTHQWLPFNLMQILREQFPDIDKCPYQRP